MTRILLYTGKGGVGKTCLAAATALLCADRGLRTIVLSTDIAHSLADAFDVPLGPEPTRIAPNLDGQEPDVSYNISRRPKPANISATPAASSSWASARSSTSGSPASTTAESRARRSRDREIIEVE